MDRQSFWLLIEKSKDAAADLSGQIGQLSKALGTLTDSDVVDFARILEEVLAESFRFKLGYALGYFRPEQYVTEDGFEYNRMWLILQGRELFQRIIENPDNLAELDVVGECEELINLPHLEYMRRHGSLGCPIEHPEPVMVDEPRTKEELDLFDQNADQIYPRLCARFPASGGT